MKTALVIFGIDEDETDVYIIGVAENMDYAEIMIDRYFGGASRYDIKRDWTDPLENERQLLLHVHEYEFHGEYDTEVTIREYKVNQ